MRLDSERQRKLLIELLGNVPVETNIRGMIAGLRPDIGALLQAIQTATVEPAPTETDHGTDAQS